MDKEKRAAMRKLVEEAAPVAYQSTRNGFIAKENKNPEYNTPLYKFAPETILQLLDYIETLEKDAARLDFITKAESAMFVQWERKPGKPVRYRMIDDGEPWGKWHSTARAAIDAAIMGRAP